MWTALTCVDGQEQERGQEYASTVQDNLKSCNAKQDNTDKRDNSDKQFEQYRQNSLALLYRFCNATGQI